MRPHSRKFPRTRAHALLYALRRERRLRLEAEANAKRFHAMLIAERIARIEKHA